MKFKTKFISREIPSKHSLLKVHPRLNPAAIGFPSRDEKDTNNVHDCANVSSKYFFTTDTNTGANIDTNSDTITDEKDTKGVHDCAIQASKYLKVLMKLFEKKYLYKYLYKLRYKSHKYR